MNSKQKFHGGSDPYRRLGNRRAHWHLPVRPMLVIILIGVALVVFATVGHICINSARTILINRGNEMHRLGVD